MKKKKQEISIVRSSAAEYLTFITATGESDVNAVYCDENVWLTQKMMGLLYNVETHTINYQELICKGWFLPPNTYDCGSFVVNGTAVVGKEKKSPYNRWKSTQKGANFYEISI